MAGVADHVTRSFRLLSHKVSGRSFKTHFASKSIDYKDLFMERSIKILKDLETNIVLYPRI